MKSWTTDSIQEVLKDLENEREIKIAYACESGSRAWDMASPDSDYDVRFIYQHPTEWYLSIQNRRDTIDLPVEDLLDLSGWDIRKILIHYGKSNIVVFEWLQSPMVYLKQGDLRDTLWNWRRDYFSPKAAVHHYLGLAKRMLYSAAEQEELRLKRLFYILRPLLAARWIIERDAVPPIALTELEKVLEDVPAIREQAADLLDQKRQGLESTTVAFPSNLQNFLHTEVQRCETIARKLPARKGDTGRLDELFRDQLNAFDKKK